MSKFITLESKQWLEMFTLKVSVHRTAYFLIRYHYYWLFSNWYLWSLHASILLQYCFKITDRSGDHTLNTRDLVPFSFVIFHLNWPAWHFALFFLWIQVGRSYMLLSNKTNVSIYRLTDFFFFFLCKQYDALKTDSIFTLNR